MSSKKISVLRDKSVPEIDEEIIKLKNELSKERSAIASGTRAEKPSRIRNTRRQIARLLTIIREKDEVKKKSG